MAAFLWWRFSAADWSWTCRQTPREETEPRSAIWKPVTPQKHHCPWVIAVWSRICHYEPLVPSKWPENVVNQTPDATLKFPSTQMSYFCKYFDFTRDLCACRMTASRVSNYWRDSDTWQWCVCVCVCSVVPSRLLMQLDLWSVISVWAAAVWDIAVWSDSTSELKWEEEETLQRSKRLE